MQSGLDGSGYISVDQPLFCPAWMIPLVNDETDKPSLTFEIEEATMSLDGTDYQIYMPTLVANPEALCNIREIGDASFAVLKRGLL